MSKSLYNHTYPVPPSFPCNTIYLSLSPISSSATIKEKRERKTSPSPSLPLTTGTTVEPPPPPSPLPPPDRRTLDRQQHPTTPSPPLPLPRRRLLLPVTARRSDSSIFRRSAVFVSPDRPQGRRHTVRFLTRTNLR
ncbi:hypothetical protein ACS0TY_001119 [Phlomoides rotata]